MQTWKPVVPARTVPGLKLASWFLLFCAVLLALPATADSLKDFKPDGELLKDAAFLSLSAAYPGGTRYPVGDLQKFRDYLSKSGDGWQLLGVEQTSPSFPGVDQKDGFYKSSNAAAFAALKGDILAVAIRGTDLTGLPEPQGQSGLVWNAQHFASGASGFVQDINSATRDPEGHYQNILPFIKAAHNYANDPSHKIHNILITGHSLGGQAAEMFAVDPNSRVSTALDVSSLPSPLQGCQIHLLSIFFSTVQVSKATC